jgi:hypothetical protein
LKMPLGQPQRASEAVRRARALRARPPASEGLLKRYQSHIFTYQVPSAVVYPLIGSWRLAGGFGLRETAHSRLKLGSARRSNPTHFFRFALIRVIRGPAPHIHTAEDCRGYNSKQAGGECLTEPRRHTEGMNTVPT